MSNTTDTNQASEDELDKILRRLVNRVERYAFEKWESQPKDYPPGFRDVLFTQNMEDEATEAILDWHNKQTTELLDRVSVTFNDAHIDKVIEAERSKLKEA